MLIVKPLLDSWLGVKSCSAWSIYINAEGREGKVDISVLLAPARAKPRCVLFYLCADWWNELGVWEIDSGWGWSPSSLAGSLAGVCTQLASPHFSSLFPSRSPLGSSRLFSPRLMLKAHLKKKKGGGGKQNKMGYVVLSVLLYLTRRRLAHHFCLYLPAKSSFFFKNLCQLLV